MAKTWQDHQVDASEVIAHKRDATQGRPRAATPCQAMEWQRPARVRPDAHRMGPAKPVGACSVLGTNRAPEQLRDVEVMAGYQGQAQAEGGCRFLKDPWFFVSSLFVKTPWRMQGLLLVMTLALLGYAVAPRRRRPARAEQNATIPHHMNQPTSRPTLRWVLQRLDGIERVRMLVDGTIREVITGVKAGRVALLRFVGQQVCLM